MARIRTIKPEFWTDEKVVQLPFEARLLFIGMWNFADDEGYLIDEPDRLRLQILPNDRVDADLLTDLLVAAGLVDRLDLQDGRTLLALPNFERHQKISHSTPTKFPASSGKKRSIPAATRRLVATKYGCEPGKSKDVTCYHCGSPGSISWWPLHNGRPSAWVCFSGVELDHFVPENSGGTEASDNIILSCRACNRSRGTKDALAFFSDKNLTTPENTGALAPEWKGRERNRIEGRERPARPLSASPIEDGWKPKPATLAKAKALGLTDTDLTKMVGRFVPHYRSKGEVSVDWDAKLESWLPDEAEKLGRKPPSPAATTTKVHVKAGTDEWKAWTKHLGKSPPQDSNFGWYFDSKWPPGHPQEQAA